ncbi:MAG: ribonuclease H-like domain-containing protein [Acidobacteria bacterium]|nr:ribonuclease H-like domain-containing protein [Acidobacteriota bacterium]
MTSIADRLSRVAALRPNAGPGGHGPGTEGRSHAEELTSLLGGRMERNGRGSHFRVRRRFAGPAAEPLSPGAWRRLSPGSAPPPCDPAEWIFLDTETTGLSGGTGTCAFLVGVGWWEADGFSVEQFFMCDYGEEPSLLEALSERLARFRVLVTYNGRSFDWPLLETRYRMARFGAVPEPPVHLDLLYPARRLWRWSLESVALAEVERHVLGFDRGGDIPSASIPQRYFDFIRGGAAGPIAEVFRHNQMDLCGLAVLALRLNRMLGDPEQSDCGGGELFGISRMLQKSGELPLAGRLFRKSLEKGLPRGTELRAQRELALMAKRERDFRVSNEFWEKLLGGTPEGFDAYEQLAIYYEHRARCPEKALGLVREALVRLRESHGSGGTAEERYRKWHGRLRRRLARLERKCAR